MEGGATTHTLFIMKKLTDKARYRREWEDVHHILNKRTLRKRIFLNKKVIKYETGTEIVQTTRMKYNKAIQKCYFNTKRGKPFYLNDNWLQQ
jgi:hypothetical protein